MGQRPQTTILNLLATGRRLGLGQSLVPEEVRRAVRTTQGALTDDARVNREAVAGALWLPRDGQIVGIATVGVAPGIAWRFPDAARIERVDAIAGTPPASGPFGVWLTVNGADVESVSIAKGATANSNPGTSITVPAGAIVRVRVASPGGAADIMFSLFYTQTGGA